MITHFGAQFLKEALKNNKNNIIEELDISKNNLTNAGMKHISELMLYRKAFKVRSLDVSDCKVKENALKTLSIASADCVSLKILKFNQNEKGSFKE